MIKLCKLYRNFKKFKAREGMGRGIQRSTESIHACEDVWQSYTKVKQN